MNYNLNTEKMSRDRRSPFYLFLFCLAVYLFTNYGGVRSPDSEIVFRVARSLALQGSFAVNEPLANWPGFGVAKGRNGNFYSVYPPLESIVLAPLVSIGSLVNKTDWYEHVRLPVSHYVQGAEVIQFVDGKVKQTWDSPQSHQEEHALRFLVSIFNPVITSLTVVVFWYLLLELTGSIFSAWSVSLFYAFGTLAWPYSGTFFSEPLLTLLALLSFYLLVRTRDASPRTLFASGLILGCCCATHATGILFAPFFLFYAAWKCSQTRKPWKIIYWLVGLAAILSPLAGFNYFRFGSIFESGRNFSQYNPLHFYGPASVVFWTNLYRLLFSVGKGLFLFCPVILLALVAWPAFHGRNRLLSCVVGSTVVVRTLFAAAYFDWHGGFSIGPRYLLAAIPFLMLPLGFWLSSEAERRKYVVPFTIAAWLCIVQQFYFCLGEIFSYYTLVKYLYQKEGMNVFSGDYLYIAWQVSPLHGLLDYRRGPYLLQSVPLSNRGIWIIGCLMIALLLATTIVVWKRKTAEQTTAVPV